MRRPQPRFFGIVVCLLFSFSGEAAGPSVNRLLFPVGLSASPLEGAMIFLSPPFFSWRPTCTGSPAGLGALGRVGFILCSM